MKKRVCVIILVLMILMATSTAVTIVKPKNHDIKPLLDLAKSLEGDILGYSVHGYIKINEISHREIANLLVNMGYDGSLDEAYYFNENQYSNFLIDWNLNDKYYKLRVIEKQKNRYLSLSVDFGPYVDVYDVYNKIREILGEFTEDVHITTSIYKELDGSLDKSHIIEKITRGFRLLSARMVKDFQNERVIAFLGHSPYLVNSIRVGGRLYNLHIAVHYDEYTDSYHLVIANPIIESSY